MIREVKQIYCSSLFLHNKMFCSLHVMVTILYEPILRVWLLCVYINKDNINQYIVDFKLSNIRYRSGCIPHILDVSIMIICSAWLASFLHFASTTTVYWEDNRTSNRPEWQSILGMSPTGVQNTACSAWILTLNRSFKSVFFQYSNGGSNFAKGMTSLLEMATVTSWLLVFSKLGSW